MADDILVVLLGDDIMGTLARQGDGRLRFDYDDSYRARPDATPLSLSLPTQVATHPDRAVTPWLWGLLPENDAVLARWAREFEVSAASPFSLLATPVGEDCAGAVRFCRPERVDEVRNRAGRVTWLSDDEIADELRALRRDATAWLGSGFTGRFSLAGAQAKTALLHHRGRWGVPSGRTPTTHILKPAIAGLDGHELNEHLCLDAAARVGLAVVKTRIGRFADERAVVVQRYDRRRSRGGYVRIHQEDFVQALGLHPSQKYQSEGGPTPARIADLFRRAMPPRAADDAVRRFADALAWNWIVAGTDAHAKNYSLVLDGADVLPAPLYDVASALPYDRIDPLSLKLAMKLGGEYGLKSQRGRHWVKAAKELRLDADTLLARVRDLATRAPDAFRDAVAAVDLSGVDSPLPSTLVDAVAKQARWCLRALEGTTT